MRILFVFLLTVAVVLAARDVRERGKRRSKAKEDLSKFNGKKNNRTEKDLDYVREKLEKMDEKLRKKYSLNSEQKEELKERLQKIGRRPEHLSNGDKLEEINGDEDDLYEGDIVLTPEQADLLENEQTDEGRAKRQAYKSSSYPSTLWSGAIPYTLDSSLSTQARTMIAKGIAFWEANTCITFKLNGTGANSIKFFSGSGCYSYIGRIAQWAQQEISIGPGCESIRTTTHEIGHALGFFHAQSREDRDSYVTINLDNIQSGKEHNFDKETTSTNYNYGQPYEYGSVMHYSPFSFAIDSSIPTIVPKQSEFLYTMGSGREPSFYDVQMMNKHYSCLAVCDKSTTVCSNGGYKDIKNCAVCKCPGGYGGKTCTERPSGCGSTVTATASYATLTSQLVGDGQTVKVDDFAECNYWITAPAGKKIEVTLTNVGYVCSEGCYYGGVEVKAQSDQKLTGYRYCCQDHKGKVITSVGNTLPIIVFNRYYYSGFTIKYRYV